jgi:hypothetical protein
MKIYQNTYTSLGGSSCGFSYHSCKRTALKEGKAAKKRTKGNCADDTVGEVTTKLLIIPATKEGILRTLNSLASHNDNG